MDINARIIIEPDELKIMLTSADEMYLAMHEVISVLRKQMPDSEKVPCIIKAIESSMGIELEIER